MINKTIRSNRLKVYFSYLTGRAKTTIASVTIIVAGLATAASNIETICEKTGWCGSDKLIMNIDLFAGPKMEDISLMSDDQYQVEYSLIENNNAINIIFTTDYDNKNTSVGILGEGPYFALPTLALDLKLINNTEKSIAIYKVSLEVSSSQTNREPMMAFTDHAGLTGEILFTNEGWGKPVLINLYARIAEHKSDYFQLPYAVSGDDYYFSIQPLVEEYGLNVKDTNKILERLYDKGIEEISDDDKKLLLDNHRLCISVFHPELIAPHVTGYEETLNTDFPYNCSIAIEGYLEYSWADALDKSTKFDFETYVNISPTDGLGSAGFDPTGEYDLELKSEGRNYVVEKPIFHTLKPGDFDRLSIPIGAEKSSSHNFKVILHYNDVEQLASKSINLDLLMPKTNSKIIKSKGQN